MRRLTTILRATVTVVVVLAAPAGLAVTAADAAGLARRVEQVAAELAAERVAPPDRLSILSVRFGGADAVPAGAYELEPVEVDGPNHSGTVRVELRVLADGTPLGRARATVRGEVRGPVLVATRTLAYDDPIPPSAVEVVDGDLTRLRTEPVRDLAQLAGRVPRRTLGPGRPITDDLVGPAAVVHRNRAVDLRVRRGALTVTARGIAKTDGVPGDVIPAVNEATGARLVGRVLEDGSLLVMHREPRSTRR